MSQVMLWERKETELTRAWMLFNRNQQTILQTEEQELGGSRHSLLFLVCEEAQGGLTDIEQFFSVFCTWEMSPTASQSFISLSEESSACSPTVPHLHSTAFL